MNEWINVKDRLPEYTDKYLVWVGINEMGAGMYPEHRAALWNFILKSWDVDHDHIRELVGPVEYWMPLPEPPKEG